MDRKLVILDPELNALVKALEAKLQEKSEEFIRMENAWRLKVRETFVENIGLEAKLQVAMEALEKLKGWHYKPEIESLISDTLEKIKAK